MITTEFEIVERPSALGVGTFVLLRKTIKVFGFTLYSSVEPLY